MILPVTITVAAATALVNLWLALRIVRLRVRDKVLTGHGGSPLMEGRMRAQANLVEYAPFVLILMALVEIGGGSATILWVLGVLFILARVAHPFGMDRDGSNPLRAFGALVTWGVLAGLAGWGLAIAYGANTAQPHTIGIELAPAHG